MRRSMIKTEKDADIVRHLERNPYEHTKEASFVCSYGFLSRCLTMSASFSVFIILLRIRENKADFVNNRKQKATADPKPGDWDASHPASAGRFRPQVQCRGRGRKQRKSMPA